MPISEKVWNIVRRNNPTVPSPTDIMKLKSNQQEIERLKAYAQFFRRETLRRFALWLDREIKRSGVVANQSQIETETAKYGKEFEISRQRISQILQAKSPDAKLVGMSLITPERVAGIAMALNLPIEQAMEAAGYRTDFGNRSTHAAASEAATLFDKMSDVQQQLTLEIMKVIVSVLQSGKYPQMTEEDTRVLTWFSALDPGTKAIFQTAIGSRVAADNLASKPLLLTEAHLPAQAEPAKVAKQGKDLKPLNEVLTVEGLGQVMSDLPLETQEKITRLLAEEGIQVKHGASFSNYDHTKKQKAHG